MPILYVVINNPLFYIMKIDDDGVLICPQIRKSQSVE